MVIIVPFRPSNPKSRLANYLTPEEREGLALCMLRDVLSAVKGEEVVVLLSEKNSSIEKEISARVEVDTRPLSDAVNAILKPESAVIMSDLPLLTEEVVRKFLNCEGDIVIAPGRRGGTNMLLVRKPFRVSYHYGSFLKHLNIARSMGLKPAIFDSFYASVDVDGYDDLLEVMLHGHGGTKRFLERIGFRVVMEEEPRLIRDPQEP